MRDQFHVLDLCTYVINVYLENNLPVDTYRANINVYYLYHDYMAYNKEPLVDQRPEAWEVGPVFPLIVHHFQNNLGRNFRRSDPFDNLPFDFIQMLFDDWTRDYISNQLGVLMQYKSDYLYESAKRKNMPYSRALKDAYPNRNVYEVNGRFPITPIIDDHYFYKSTKDSEAL